MYAADDFSTIFGYENNNNTFPLPQKKKQYRGQGCVIVKLHVWHRVLVLSSLSQTDRWQVAIIIHAHSMEASKAADICFQHANTKGNLFGNCGTTAAGDFIKCSVA